MGILSWHATAILAALATSTHVPACGGQGDLVCGQALSGGRFHCDQSELGAAKGNPLLQPTGDSRTVDQRRQVRIELDAPFLPRLCRKPSPIAVVCPGVQLGQLSTPLGSAPIYQPLVITHLADQVDQDRRQSGQACSLHLLPNGGRVDLTKSVRGHSETDSPIDAARTCVTNPVCQRNQWPDSGLRGNLSWQYCCVTKPPEMGSKSLSAQNFGGTTG